MYVKYPRTKHLPWSPGGTDDDERLFDCSSFLGKEIVVTEKFDGENTTMYSDYIHARSVDSIHHPSRTWIKSLHASIKSEIPLGWRICGENLYAKHSIGYEDLPSYFMVFSIWTDQNICLSWTNTVEWCQLLELEHVPLLYRGEWDMEFLKNSLVFDSTKVEGYVVRLASSFWFADFGRNVAKYVRKDHV